MKLITMIKDASEDGVCSIQGLLEEMQYWPQHQESLCFFSEQIIYLCFRYADPRQQTYVPFSWSSLGSSKPKPMVLLSWANLESLMAVT